MPPIFSIITITYNAEKTIAKTIESIVNQTYSNIEYILIDGKSTDGTMQIVDKYSSKIAYRISEPDKGLYDAMNKGLAAATGDYVWFINSGDTIYSSDTLEKIISKINATNLPDIIYGETAIVDDTGNFNYMRRLKAPEKLTWKSFRMGMLVCHQAFIAKRNIAPDYDLQYRFSSDFDWCIRCLKRSNNIYNSHQIVVNYLEEGTTTSNHKLSLKERYRIMVKYYGRISVFLFHLWFAIRFYVAKVKGKR